MAPKRGKRDGPETGKTPHSYHLVTIKSARRLQLFAAGAGVVELCGPAPSTLHGVVFAIFVQTLVVDSIF
jgi:hypothetical protein